MSGMEQIGVSVVVGVLLVVSGVGSEGAVAATDNEAPLADAGLDREVGVNATVYLDATGSYDPDGEITGYEWEIEQPDGMQTDPSCGSCARTEFVVRESGTYNVTVTVTDDDGAERSDTLRVDVSAVKKPSVSIDGPTSAVANQRVNVTATLTAGEHPLSRVDWRVDGSTEKRENLDGSSASVDLNTTFDAGNLTIEVEVYDELGRSTSTTHNLTVAEPERREYGPSDGGGLPGVSGTACSRYGGSNDQTQHSDDTYCHNDRLMDEGTTLAVHDADNDGTIQYANVELDEEFAQTNDDVAIETDGTVRFEDHDTYEETVGVSPNTSPDAPTNRQNNQQDDADTGGTSGTFSDTGGNDNSGILDSSFGGFWSGSSDDEDSSGSSDGSTDSGSSDGDNSDGGILPW